MKYIVVNALLCIVALMNAQPSNSFLYENLKIHTATGTVIEKGYIGVQDGTIDYVGEQMPKKIYDQMMDGQGMYAYPGIIAPNTRLGLEEIQAVRATLDYNEVGRFNPNVRSVIAYDTDSDVVPTIRSNGILFAQVVPEGGIISGQSSIVRTEGDNWESAAFALDNCIHLRWPSRIRYTGWWAQKGRTEMNKNYQDNLQAITVYFDAALAYSKKKKIERKNLKFETMRALFSKGKTLIVHVNDVKSIIDAVGLFKNYGVKIVLQGANDAWKVAKYLKENKVSVILNDVHRIPAKDDDDIDLCFKIPKLLQDAGVKFTFSLNAQGSWNVRNLMFQAGQAVAYGLDYEDALKALTINAAEILGVDKQIGSLEVGKEASFIVSKGDIMDMKSSVIEKAYLNGRPVDLGDKQKELNEKYRQKYKLD